MSDTQNRPATFDHLRKRKKRAELELQMCMDQELAVQVRLASIEVDKAKAAATMASSQRDKTETRRALRAAEAELDVAKAAAEAETDTFVFRSIGRKPYEDLKALHPPTKELQDEAEAKGEDPADYNELTFPQALVAASLAEVRTHDDDGTEIVLGGMTEGEVCTLWEDPEWGEQDLLALWNYALLVNQQSNVLHLGKG